MKKYAIITTMAFVFALFGITGCGEEQPTQGDAEIIKSTPKNLNPPAKARREAAGAGPIGAASSGR